MLEKEIVSKNVRIKFAQLSAQGITHFCATPPIPLNTEHLMNLSV